MVGRIYTDSQLKEIARLINPFLVRIHDRGSVHAGQSGSQVRIVDFKVDEQEYRTHLLKTFTSIYNDAADSEARYRYMLTILKGGSEDSFTNYSSFTYEITTLVSEVLQNRHKRVDPYANTPTLPKLIRAFEDAFEIADSERIKLLNFPPQGFHYFKVHADAHEETREALRKYREFADNHDNIPDLSAFVDYRGSILAFYRPAFNDIDDKTVKSFDDLAQKEHIPVIIRLMPHVANWLDGVFASDTISHMPDELPQMWLKKFLGDRRYEPGDSVVDRLIRFLENDQPVIDNIENITELSALQFDGLQQLPNPIAALYTSDLWELMQLEKQDNHGRLSAPITRAHGDLHFGNIIHHTKSKNSRYQEQASNIYTNTNVEMPAIIDFGDYTEEQSAFFDPLYLELNILLKLLPLESPENRSLAYNFLANHLFNDAHELTLVKELDSDVTTDIDNAFRCIEALRESCSRRLIQQRNRDYRKVFWITAVAVGLNYVRKRTIITYQEKIFCLMYAALAFRNLLKLNGVIFEELSYPTPIRIQWRDVSRGEGTVKRGSLSDELAEQLNDPNRRLNLVLVLGEDVHPFDMKQLYSRLYERLRWMPDIDLPDARDAIKILQTYRRVGGDTNLRLVIEKMTAQLAKPEITKVIEYLADETPVRIITYDWHTYGKFSYSQHQKQLIHVCGHPSLNNSVYRYEEFDYEEFDAIHPDSILDTIHQHATEVIEGYEDITVREAPTHVVILGQQDFRNSLTQKWYGIFERNPRIRITHVADEPLPNLEEIFAPRTAFYQMNPQQFLQELAEKIEGTAESMIQSTFAEPYQNYIPQPVNQTDIIDLIKDPNNPNHFVVYSEPGRGKSSLIRKLCTESDEENLPHVIVDFAAEPAFAKHRMNIMHFIFEHFDNMPDLNLDEYYDIQMPYNIVNQEKNSIEEVYLAIWLYEFIDRSRNVGTFQKNIYLCFDGCEMALGTIEWLNIHFPPETTITNKAPWMAWINRGIADAVKYINSPTFACPSTFIMVNTMRLSGENVRGTTLWKTEFVVRSLDPLDNHFIQRILLDIIENDDQLALHTAQKRHSDVRQVRQAWRYFLVNENVDEPLSNEIIDNLSGNARNNLDRQLANYITFCNYNMMAVVALIRHHLWKNFAVGDFPTTSDEIGSSYEAIHRAIEADIRAKVQMLIEKTPQVDIDDYTQTFLWAILCRRLDRSLAKTVFNLNTEVEANNHLASLRQVQLFYDRLNPDSYVQSNQYSNSSYLLVTPSLHSMVLGYYSTSDDNEAIFKDLYKNLIIALLHRLDNEQNRSDEYKSYDVLDIVYYYHALHSRGLAVEISDIQPDTSPKDFLRTLADYYFNDPVDERLQLLRLHNAMIKPPLPDELW